MVSDSPGSRVTAVLGPTNTGKTHLAMERMLGYGSGMIGFPLRLLARENYDKAVRRVGPAAVALITGEEKILPARPRYFICTVESMPVDRRVDFIAIDEIQLCGDPDRGHVFTDRLLHARGQQETMFLGAETMAPLIRRLVPGCGFDSRPRFSQLSFAGHKKLTRLPRRSAVVAFSADDVYAIAELIRRQRGGAAVVMGALSPRTRNAQVDLYQSGEVDWLVATDAIGMGLNMDVGHVAFASMKKFDGYGFRALTAPEVAQIAGRAGRHMNDGTFGTTADADAPAEDVVTRVEGHAFAPQRQIFWRNTNLDFRSIDHLLASLGAPPPDDGLMRPRRADDTASLETLARDPEIASRARDRRQVALLWDVCRVPDFRKLRAETHVRLLGQLYRHLSTPRGVLPEDFVNGHVTRIDRVDGDIHALVDRIAAVRVWTYVAHQNGWLADPESWQKRTRAIEDKLSDALHDRLTQRFVDRRTATLMRRLGDREALLAAVDKDDGAVVVEGHAIGHLHGLTFHPESTGGRHGDKAVLNAAQKALRQEIAARVGRMELAEDDAFHLDDTGRLLWEDAPVATLAKGASPLTPVVVLPADGLLDGPLAERVRARLERYLSATLDRRLKVLRELEGAPDLKGSARGLAFQLAEAFGTLPREPVDAQVRALSEADRKALARRGVRLGLQNLFMPDLLKPEAQRLRALLWSVSQGRRTPPPLPPAGRVSFPIPPGTPRDFLEVLGFQLFGQLAIRVDMIERFAAEVRKLIRERGPASASKAAGKSDPRPEDTSPPEGERRKRSRRKGRKAATGAEEALAPAPAPVAEPVPVTEPSPPAGSADGVKAPAPRSDPRPAAEAQLPADLLSTLGLGPEDGGRVLDALGYKVRLEDGGVFLRPRRRRFGPARRPRGVAKGPVIPRVDPDSPFAALGAMIRR